MRLTIYNNQAYYLDVILRRLIMSTETLSIEQVEVNTLDNETVSRIGMTVFEKLAKDTETESFEATSPIEIKNSLTRMPDGQTVPDER